MALSQFVERKKMFNWEEYVKSTTNSKVMVMLSGGKDSVATLFLLKSVGLEVTAIHFFHKWSSQISTDEAVRICKAFNTPLILYDYTNEFFNAIENFTGGRPCLLCKKVMYKLLLEKLYSLRNENYGWLAIGDNANDCTTIKRMIKYFRENGLSESLECSSYFGSEMGISLPPGMKVLRPLISYKAEEVEDLLEKNNVKLQRINSTGDKYFDYHREGCPIQFADFGVPICEELLHKLKRYNDAITTFARDKGILASIHLPSTFIVTIPEGFETEAANYLITQGLPVEKKNNSGTLRFKKSCVFLIDDANERFLFTDVYKSVFQRFVERLELNGKTNYHCFSSKRIVCDLKNKQMELILDLDLENCYTVLTYRSSEENTFLSKRKMIKNLIIELLRTRKFTELRE